MVNGKVRPGEPIQATKISSTNLYHTNMAKSSSSPALMSSLSARASTPSASATITTTKGQSALLPPNRKVFMITEKCAGENDKHNGDGSSDAMSAGRKRKMILIMDEKPSQNDQINQEQQQRTNGTKHIKIEGDETMKSLSSSTSTSTSTPSSSSSTPKLLFFSNSVDDHLSQKIEEILPEILSRIQWKNGRGMENNEIAGNTSLSSSKQKKSQHASYTNGCGNLKSNINAGDVLATTAMMKTEQMEFQTLFQNEFSDCSNSEQSTIYNQQQQQPHEHEHQDSNNTSNLMLLGAAAAAKAAASNTNESTTMRRITLPPKKNHIKLQKQLNTTTSNNNNNNNCNNFTNGNINNGREKIISAATPVIVSATSLNKTFNQVSALKTTIADNDNHHHHQQQQQQNHLHQQINKSNRLNGSSRPLQQDSQDSYQHQQQQQQQQQHHKHKLDSKNHNNLQNNKINNNNQQKTINSHSDEKTTKNGEKNSIVVQQQNINLTGDFLFLMKMLPMLEKTSEPRKTQVKMLIEKILKQCVSDDRPE